MSHALGVAIRIINDAAAISAQHQLDGEQGGFSSELLSPELTEEDHANAEAVQK